jgi:hypothetical protein
MTEAAITAEHYKRVREDLRRAGVSRYGLLKNESRYIPKLIHADEQIKGVVYGRYDNGSAMLVATNKRVIFLDKKVLFTTFDEVSYDIVSGVSLSSQNGYGTLTLYTRVANYCLRFVNTKAARQFVTFLESNRLEQDPGPTNTMHNYSLLHDALHTSDSVLRFAFKALKLNRQNSITI